MTGSRIQNKNTKDQQTMIKNKEQYQSATLGERTRTITKRRDQGSKTKNKNNRMESLKTFTKSMTRTENKQQKLRANIMNRTKTEHNDQAREKHNEQTRINHKNERKHQEQLTNRKTISKIK